MFLPGHYILKKWPPDKSGQWGKCVRTSAVSKAQMAIKPGFAGRLPYRICASTRSEAIRYGRFASASLSGERKTSAHDVDATPRVSPCKKIVISTSWRWSLGNAVHDIANALQVLTIPYESILIYVYRIRTGAPHQHGGFNSPTQTKFVAEVGLMQINLTFLNPIEPKDWVKLIPFSYLSLCPCCAELQNGCQGVIYGPASKYSRVHLNRVVPRREERCWTTKWACHFLPQHSLNSTAFAISRDLGITQATQDPTVWAVGYTVEPALN
ncbi:hypothetical protein EDB89DRAFT_2249618 [Lactarius sanguifluus]|nr:hypothetical protein EDB89DRAFT_2249618 [Lactarius sanguifluus]